MKSPPSPNLEPHYWQRLAMKLIAGSILIALAIWLVPGMSDFPLTARGATELALMGVIVGAYGTLVGAGGGFLLVPALLLYWHLPPAQAAGTSLVAVFFNATAGSISMGRLRRIDYRSGIWLATATLPGSVAGAYLARFASGRTFSLTFAILLLLTAALLIWRPLGRGDDADIEHGPEHEMTAGWVARTVTDRRGRVFHYRYYLPLALILSFGIGFLSSALGIGGAIIHVPAMIHLLHFPALIATATSGFILAISALVGAGTHISLGHVLFGPAALMGVGAVTGAQIGAAVARRVKGAVTVRLFSLAMIAVAVRLLLR